MEKETKSQRVFLATNKAFFLIIIAASIIGGFIFPFYAYSHPGRTDAYGCHTCRTNCPSWGLSYGEYHCHRAKALPQPEPPIKSHREGYTEPAPEYESPTPEYQLPAPEKLTAEIPKENNGESIWWWVIGIGFVGYFLYNLIRRKR